MISVMNTLYIHCQTKDYILDIVAAHAGMRIYKVNSVLTSNQQFQIYASHITAMQGGTRAGVSCMSSHL